jgi:hypothetical protein
VTYDLELMVHSVVLAIPFRPSLPSAPQDRSIQDLPSRVKRGRLSDAAAA